MSLVFITRSRKRKYATAGRNVVTTKPTGINIYIGKSETLLIISSETINMLFKVQSPNHTSESMVLNTLKKD